jgi:hypothetical protein
MVLPVVGPTPSCIEELQALLIEEKDFISRDAVHGPLSRDFPLHKFSTHSLRAINSHIGILVQVSKQYVKHSCEVVLWRFHRVQNSFLGCFSRPTASKIGQFDKTFRWKASKANCINRVYGAGDGNRNHRLTLLTY